jgi:hypothetical protein
MSLQQGVLNALCRLQIENSVLFVHLAVQSCSYRRLTWQNRILECLIFSSECGKFGVKGFAGPLELLNLFVEIFCVVTNLQHMTEFGSALPTRNMALNIQEFAQFFSVLNSKCSPVC